MTNVIKALLVIAFAVVVSGVVVATANNNYRAGVLRGRQECALQVCLE